MAQSKKTKRSRLAFPAGLLAIALAIVGAVTVVKYSFNSIKEMADKTADKQQYEEFLKPVVMFDPDTFDDIKQADVPQLVNSAIWALLMDEKSADQYEYSEGDTVGILLPQEEIEQKFAYLFGSEIDISTMHSTIDMSEYDISYDGAKKSYIIPITGIESAYTPKVYEIEKKGSSVILSVGYIGNRAWVQLEDNQYAAPEPDKYMQITLREGADGKQYIAAIQAVDGQEIASVTTAKNADNPVVPATTAAATTSAPAETTTAEPATDEDGSVISTEGETSEDETTEEETEE